MNRSVGRIIGAALAAVGVGVGTVGVVAGPAAADTEPKVEICHATSSHSNPYRRIEVKVSSLDGVGNNDHSLHTGPVWFDGITEDWGDIIPPPHGIDGLGVNWTADGQAIFDGLDDLCGALECDPEEDEACEPACDPQTDPNQCVEPCPAREERVQGVCTPVCTPTTANNQCTPCPPAQVADGQGGCAVPCEPSEANNRCTPCPPGRLANGQGGCTTPCEPTEANNQCTPCPPGQVPSGQGTCTTPIDPIVPVVQPVVVPTAAPDADAVDCAGPGATPGIAVTLRNTGTADAVFSVLVDGVPFGDAATLTVTPAEGTATVTAPQAEDDAAVVVVEAEGLNVVVPLAGDCAQEVVLPAELEAAPVLDTTEQLPTEVEGVQHVRTVRQELPRTGSTTQNLVVLAGVLLLLGGLTLFGSTLVGPAQRD